MKNALIALVHPLTKRKAHRLVHAAVALCSGLIVLGLWLAKLDTSTQVEATIAASVLIITNIRKALSKADAIVDTLPIPEDDTSSQEVGPENENPRDPMAGHATPGIVFLILFATLALFVGARLAHAQGVGTPDASKWKLGPSVAVAVGYVDVTTGDYFVGPSALPLGACLGATFKPYDLGADFCANVQVGTAEPNRYFPSVMVHWRNYFNAGAGILGRQKIDRSGIGWRPVVLIGGRFAFLGG